MTWSAESGNLAMYWQHRTTAFAFFLVGWGASKLVEVPFTSTSLKIVAEASAVEVVDSAGKQKPSAPVAENQPINPQQPTNTIAQAHEDQKVGDPKPATEATRRAQSLIASKLDLQDQQDFEDAQRGFIAALPDQGHVRNSAGKTVWNLAERAVAPLDQSSPDTVNPSLWRQAQLLGIGGLFRVSDRIYQVRGLDLANITFIEGDSGLIVIDPLLSAETAKAALELYFQHRPRVPVQSVIITHSHPDHFGGIAGIVTEEQVSSGSVTIIAPKFFLEEVFSENVLAGNAMQRRAGYMYGNLLPKGPRGDIGNGLGLGTSTGASSLIKPTDSIHQTGEVRVLDGLTFEFQLTPGSEAPAEMHVYIQELKGLCPAENATHTMHNLYTLRGAKIRDARAWSNYLQQTVELFGDRTDVMFAPHHWPIWGQERIVNHLVHQRDLYKYIHDQTLRMANSGHNMQECAEQIQLPQEVENYWANRGYYGCLNQNVKAVWNFYLGWFDGNPARLNPLPPREAGARYVRYMGGMARVLDLARQSFDEGDYRWVVQVMDHAVAAEPDRVESRELLADALEQLGYQAECGPWRNFYLSGAQELRLGIKSHDIPTIDASQSISALPLGAIFDSMAVRLNNLNKYDKNITVNFKFTDTDEEYMLTLKNGVLNHFAGKQHTQADCTVCVTRPAFNEILNGRSNFVRKVFLGDASIAGSPRSLLRLFQTVERFEPWFEVMLPQPLQNRLNEIQ